MVSAFLNNLPTNLYGPPLDTDKCSEPAGLVVFRAYRRMIRPVEISNCEKFTGSSLVQHPKGSQ